MKLSFTAISLGLREFEILIELYLDLGDWEKVSKEVINEDLFQQTSQASVIRQCREIRQRIQSLQKETLEDFIEWGPDERKFIAFLAICKTYPFVFDFVSQVLGEKLAIYDYQLQEVDFTAYWNDKLMEYPELDNITESTKKKIKQVLVRTLSEAGLIDGTSSQRITPYFPIPGLDEVFQREGNKYRKALLTA
jgi:hypothetical protein